MIRVDRNARLAAMLIHGRKLVLFPLFRDDTANTPSEGESEAQIRCPPKRGLMGTATRLLESMFDVYSSAFSDGFSIA